MGKENGVMMLLAVVLFVLGVIIEIISLSYLFSLSARRKEKEAMKRNLMLYQDIINAESAKQYARTIGDVTRSIISIIAE